MKKIVILIAIAAVVGFFISRTRTPNGENQDGTQGNHAGAGNRVVKADSAIEAAGGEVGREGSQPAGSSSGPSVTDTGQQNGGSGATGDTKTGGSTRTGNETKNKKTDDAASASKGRIKETEKKSGGGNTSSGEKSFEKEQGASEKGQSARLKRGLALMKKGRSLKARKVLTAVYRNAGEAERERARRALHKINRELVFNPRVVDGARVHTVQSGETLSTIADQYDVNWRMIQRINGIDRPGLIRVGQKLKVLDGPRRIVVDKSDFRLTLFIDGVFIREYAVGLGKNNKTPEGEFEVEEMLIKPDWYPPWGGVVEYGDEDHLIGVRWIGLSDQPGASGYGIHGTSDPDSIGKMCSNGCIRMLNESVKELYDFVNSGTKVIIKE